MRIQCYGCHEYHWHNAVDGGCVHDSTPNWDVRAYIAHEQGCPSWCPRLKEVNDLKENKQENIKMDSKKFDFDESTAQVKNNALNAFDTAKNVVVQMQQGDAVITAVRSALLKAPGCPDNMKILLATPYGDMVVGMILHTIAPVLTGSPMIMKAVKAANVAGAVKVSQQFTFIQDAIESAIGSIPGFETLKGMAENKVDTIIDDATAGAEPTAECPNCKGVFKVEVMRDGLCQSCWNNAEPAEREAE